MFLVWLPILSYVMVMALNEISDAWDISPAIMAMTVGAAGTSFPDFVASLVVAKQGQGSMACSNAFGSNIFNIFVASGVPWALYATFSLTPEDKLAAFTSVGSIGISIPSPEIASGVVTLAVSLLAFLLVMVLWRFAFAWVSFVVAQVLERPL